MGIPAPDKNIMGKKITIPMVCATRAVEARLEIR